MNIAKKINVLIIMFILISLNIKNLHAIENKILFKIDNEIITSIDIYEEIKFLKIFNPEVVNLSENELFEISKNSILRDKIKKIEIMNYVKELKVDDKFLLRFIKNRYSNKGLDSIESFQNYLKDNDLNIKTVFEKIAIELIWNDVIFQKFQNKININKKKIKEEILKNPQQKIQKELSLSEIVFDVNQKSEFEQKYKKILLDIEQTGFKNAALIHSSSDTASVGGVIGWVKEDNLNKEIMGLLKNLNKGQYSKPIRTSVGFLIIKIEDIKEYEIEFDLNKKIKEVIQFKTNEQLDQFSKIYFNKIKKDLIFDDL
jgi:peptidyl-prolyl cis-trans isomerase SurA|tara:strand:+ start:4943 stop:5887 length:945 start_codon:yes stop_codon:yes gene_type:complete